MRYILNFIYLLALAVYLPVIAYQRILSGKKRPGIWTKFLGGVAARDGSEKCVWFHAVSLGEVNAIKLLVEKFHREHRDLKVVISTTTQTGYDAAQKSFPHCSLIYFPFDFTWAVANAIQRIRPSLVVIAELEIWPNFLRECETQNVKTCIVNGRLSEKSLLQYKRLNWLLRQTLKRLDRVCVQNKSYAKRFAELGVHADQISVSGNLKFDTLLFDQRHENILSFRNLVNVTKTDTVFCAGSTQAPEEEIAIASYLELSKQHPRLRMLICPRHPERFSEVASLLTKHSIPYSLRSELSENGNDEATAIQRVVLLDAMGELKYWWGVADIAFVGGSFGNRGGQNMLEPAALGAAVCFGPNTRNFANEVELMLSADAAHQLTESNELTKFIDMCCRDPESRNQLGQNAVRLLSSHRNDGSTATQKTLRLLESLLPASNANSIRPEKAA